MVLNFILMFKEMDKKKFLCVLIKWMILFKIWEWIIKFKSWCNVVLFYIDFMCFKENKELYKYYGKFSIIII